MFTVNLSEVKVKGKNHLIFKGFVLPLYLNDQYHFDFCGTELTTTAGIPDENLEVMRQELIKDYGFAPYDGRKAKKILKEKFQYNI